MRDIWEIERSAHAEVLLHAERATRVAVIADTHAEPHPAALGLLQAYAPDVILHAGDIGGQAVLDTFATAAPQLIAVRGNIDGRANGLPDAVVIHCRRGGKEVTRWLLVHIGVQGARLRSPIRALATREAVDLVICGHSHVPLLTRDGAHAVFNPGSIGPRRFHLPIVFGTVSVEPGGVRFGHVDCVTGQPWHP